MADCPFLTDCASRFDQAGRSFETLVAGIDSRQANWKPAPRRWSVAECIEHLNISARGYFPKMEDAIRRGKERLLLGTAPYRRWSFLGRTLLRALDPEANRTVSAPGVFRPSSGQHDFGAVCDELRTGLEQFGDLVERGDGLDLGRIRLASPIAPIPRLTLAEAFRIHTLHIPRHLAQAKRVTETAGYPG